MADALAPGDRNEIAKTIGQMFLAYQQVKLGPEETRATIALYVAQVQEFPQWAVAQGCQRIIQRPTAWPPSAGEMRSAVEREARPARDEREAINSVLNAEIEEIRRTGDRDRMKAGLRDLVTELGGVKHGKREHTKDEAAAWLEDEKANPRPLPKLSAVALKICGVEAPDTSSDDFAEMREILR
ncbi:MAG: hypothetical protein P4M15_07330 [Alphaproteobacteria bacterium]|nr:hypothetical protein [Alphaproteobacteria bacterium]